MGHGLGHITGLSEYKLFNKFILKTEISNRVNRLITFNMKLRGQLYKLGIYTPNTGGFIWAFAYLTSKTSFKSATIDLKCLSSGGQVHTPSGIAK